MRQDEIVLLLPEIFRRTYRTPGQGENVLAALLGVMETLHQPDEDILDQLERYFAPERVPAEKAGEFLPFLARWVDLDWLLPRNGEYEAGLGCLRELILDAPRLAAGCGTRQGLAQFLEIATGLGGFRVDDDPRQPFGVIVYCPPEAEKLRPLVERIIANQKPAYVTVTAVVY